MPLYRYEALDQSGKAVIGAMQAGDPGVLSNRLQAMGYQPLMVEPAPSAPVRPTPAGPVASPLTADDNAAARMYHQLAASFHAGMPAFQALSTVAGQSFLPAVRQVLHEMSLGVRDGQTISSQMERYPRVFRPGEIGAVVAAEAGGFLPQVLALLAEQRQEDENVRGKLRIWVWLLHSNVVVLFLAIAVAAWFAPAIAALDARAGIPAVLRVFGMVSVPAWVLYFGGIAWFQRFRHEDRIARPWHSFLLRVPGVREVHRARAGAIFTRMLQHLYHAGIAAPTCWETAAAAIPNRVLQAQTGACLPQVTATGRFSTAMQTAPAILDPVDIGMVMTGESTGEIESALRSLADHHADRARAALTASVVRATATCVLWTLILGGLALVALAQGYYGTVFQAIDRGFGVGE